MTMQSYEDSGMGAVRLADDTSEERGVQEADDALLVLRRARALTADMRRLRDLPQRRRLAGRFRIAAVELLADALLRRGDQQHGLFDLRREVLQVRRRGLVGGHRDRQRLRRGHREAERPLADGRVRL